MSKSDETPSTGRRGLLKDLLGLSAAATLLPLAGAAQAGIGDQPPRRPGIEGKRYGMLVDLRKCIGCQACTVSCSVENLPPSLAQADILQPIRLLYSRANALTPEEVRQALEQPDLPQGNGHWLALEHEVYARLANWPS